MTTKEKAVELVEYFEDYVHNSPHGHHAQNTKACATKCVNEIITACEYNNVESWNSDWWIEVKLEIVLY